MRLAAAKLATARLSDMETSSVRLIDDSNTRLSVESSKLLPRVEDIRLALRRRYMTRKNFKAIFDAWRGNQSSVTASTLTDMLVKLGIPCTNNEAQLLIATADQDKSNDLSLKEFIDLVQLKNTSCDEDHNFSCTHEEGLDEAIERTRQATDARAKHRRAEATR